MKKRICIIGLPRTGSNYLAELIKKNCENFTNLGEPFTPDFPLTIVKNHNGVLMLEIKKGQMDLRSVVDNCLEQLRGLNSTQNIIIKLFPYSELDTYFKEIIDELKKLNFNFVYLKRHDTVKQLLSYGMALSTNKWILLKSESETNKQIEITHFAQMQWLYRQIKNFDKLVNSLGIEYDVIYYETVLEQLSNYIGKQVTEENLSIIKQSTNNSYDQISNSKIVKTKLKRIINMHKKDLKIDPLDTICDLKWNYPIFNMDRGEFRSCCRTTARQVTQGELESKGADAFLNSDHQIQSRLDLIQGRKNKDCQSCWNLEDQGMTSPRHDALKFWDHLYKRKQIDQSLKYSEETLKIELGKIDSLDHPSLKSRHPYMLEISLGNTCDMKCMYCTHHYSTQWATERIKWGEITQEQLDEEFPKAPEGFDDAFWKWFDTVKLHLGRLGIIGGEPLIMPEFYTFVDRLIASTEQVRNFRKTKMKFWVVTNMNTPPNYLEKFFKYLPKLTEVFDVEILVSMESVGKRAEYIRNGVNWDKFTSNIDKLLSRKDLNFTFGFILSLNALNLSSLREFIEFTENLYFTHNKPVALKQNIISFPDWQSPFILTPDFADYIDECIDYMKVRTNIMPIVSDYFGRWDQYIIFLETLSSSIRNGTGDKTSERKKFVEWFKTYDHRRNINLLETFPEYKNFYKMCEGLNEKTIGS